MAENASAVAFGNVRQVRTFFDRQYASHERYWWRGENRYSIDPTVHTEFYATLLAVATRRGSGFALDLGAGEGADAIRLAKLGYKVDAVEVSAVACEKIKRNGCLHYVRDKSRMLRRVLAASAGDAVHAVAVFSTATPVPAEHAVVPVFPDKEGGVVERFYQDWDMLLHAYQRGRREHSHPGFGPHVHSHIKLIATRKICMAGDR
jgi:hypothetical protein